MLVDSVLRGISLLGGIVVSLPFPVAAFIDLVFCLELIFGSIRVLHYLVGGGSQ